MYRSYLLIAAILFSVSAVLALSGHNGVAGVLGLIAAAIGYFARQMRELGDRD